MHLQLSSTSNMHILCFYLKLVPSQLLCTTPRPPDLHAAGASIGKLPQNYFRFETCETGMCSCSIAFLCNVGGFQFSESSFSYYHNCCPCVKYSLLCFLQSSCSLWCPDDAEPVKCTVSPSVFVRCADKF